MRVCEFLTSDCLWAGRDLILTSILPHARAMANCCFPRCAAVYDCVRRPTIVISWAQRWSGSIRIGCADVSVWVCISVAHHASGYFTRTQLKRLLGIARGVRLRSLSAQHTAMRICNARGPLSRADPVSRKCPSPWISPGAALQRTDPCMSVSPRAAWAIRQV